MGVFVVGFSPILTGLTFIALFMHLGGSHGTVRLAAGIALFMLAILFGLSATEYANRRIYPATWQRPHQLPPLVPRP